MVLTLTIEQKYTFLLTFRLANNVSYKELVCKYIKNTDNSLMVFLKKNSLNVKLYDTLSPNS